MVPDKVESEAKVLCATAQWCHARGWVPATSGNFSVRDGVSGRILISPSGLDKGTMTRGDLLEVDSAGKALESESKPSAETALHAVIYRRRPDAGAILHVHTVWNTLVSARFVGQGHIDIEGYELLKGLAGVTTHLHCERIPILENTQDYLLLSTQLDVALAEVPDAHGVLLSRHGLYTWGESVAEARRHLEALEFLFEVEERRLGRQV
jgi:methylthioribulose-1-phosphate dehydratase